MVTARLVAIVGELGPGIIENESRLREELLAEDGPCTPGDGADGEGAAGTPGLAEAKDPATAKGVAVAKGKPVGSKAGLGVGPVGGVENQNQLMVDYLMLSLRHGVPFDLVADCATADPRGVARRMTMRVRDELGLGVEVARQVVEAWALALGVDRLDAASSEALQARARTAIAPPARQAGRKRLAAGIAAALLVIGGLAFILARGALPGVAADPGSAPSPGLGPGSESNPDFSAIVIAIPDEPGEETGDTGGASGTGGSGGATSGSRAGPQVLCESAHPYGPDLDAAWVLTRAGSLELRLRFSRVSLGDGDFFSIKDKSGVVAQSFRPGFSARGVWTDWIGGERLTLSLETDDAGSDWGFALDRVETRVALPSGSLAESFHPYGNNTRYSWTVSREGVRVMRLHFARIELGVGDYIAVKDTAGKVLKRFIDGYAARDVWTDWFPVDSVVVEFQTNYGDCRWGFVLDDVETQ